MKPTEVFPYLLDKFGPAAVWGTLIAGVVIIAFVGFTGCESCLSSCRDARSDEKHEEWQEKDAALQQQIDTLNGRAAELQRQQTEAELRHQEALTELQEKLNAVEQAAQRSQQTRTVYRDARRGRIPNANKPVSDTELRELTNP